uniref:Uncharacterized protein n=1 Tax=Ditylenchus dipsaci TaxID=166011 RepID=A0A915EMY6_9BILA
MPSSSSSILKPNVVVIVKIRILGQSQLHHEVPKRRMSHVCKEVLQFSIEVVRALSISEDPLVDIAQMMSKLWLMIVVPDIDAVEPLHQRLKLRQRYHSHHNVCKVEHLGNWHIMLGLITSRLMVDVHISFVEFEEFEDLRRLM